MLVQNFRVALEIGFHVIFRLVPPNAQLPGKAKPAHAVHQSEIDGLGCAPLIQRDRIMGDPEYFRRRGPVHVTLFPEGLTQGRIFRDMGHDAKFDLRIVGCNQDTSRARDESLANPPALFRSDWNILQIRVGRR